MNILLIGSGGREHALAKGLKQSASCDLLFALPGNPGILTLAQKVTDCSLNDPNTIISFCKRNAIELVVIGPEAPLVNGLADMLTDKGISVFGPSALAARIESSKSFSKELMISHNIPTARYTTFTGDQAQFAHDYIEHSLIPIVIKADGLAAGKGVIVAESKQEAHDAINDIFSGLFADAGSKIVIEEFLQGEEASVFAICDGENFVMLAPAQDHKRIYDNDVGKNTGGMGAYAPAPIVTDEVLQKVADTIFTPTLKAMKEAGYPFVGCLFCGLMIDNGNPSVIEFNCRFGDPETQAVLTVFEGDLAALLYSAANGSIQAEHMKQRSKGFACNIVLASGGYPDHYNIGYKIYGTENINPNQQITIYHAGTSQDVDNNIITSGGRVLGVCAHAETLSEAIQKAYKSIEHISFQGMYFRKDIGKKGLAVTN